MNVALTQELEELIEAKISSGPYGSAIEVIDDALRLLDERDRSGKTRWKALRHEISRGVEQLDNGEKAPLDISEIKHKARALRASD